VAIEGKMKAEAEEREQKRGVLRMTREKMAREKREKRKRLELDEQVRIAKREEQARKKNEEVASMSAKWNPNQPSIAITNEVEMKEGGGESKAMEEEEKEEDSERKGGVSKDFSDQLDFDEEDLFGSGDENETSELLTKRKLEDILGEDEEGEEEKIDPDTKKQKSEEEEV